MSDASAINAYGPLEKLGEGWSGEVFKTTLVASRFGQPPGTTVVLKVYKSVIYDADPNIRRRIEREGQLMTSIVHANVVRALGVESIAIAGEARTALVMEYCAGGDLTSHVRQHHPFSEPDLEVLVSGLVSALVLVHRSGIIHRDVKPQNVLVGDAGFAKLGDFGVARVVIDTTMTGSEQFLGTIRYAAPEVLDGERESTGSDVYSLGLVLYELLYGTPPLNKIQRFSALIAAIVDSGPEWPSSVNRFVTTPGLLHVLVEQVARRMTARKTAERPSIDQVEEWLGQGRAAEPLVTAVRSAVSESLKSQGDKWKEKAGSNAWISIAYNAARVVEAMTDADVVQALTGFSARAIEARPELMARAIDYLPWATYRELPLERRTEMANSFLGDYPYWVGQAPWDEGIEIANQKYRYLKALGDLIKVETDEGLRKRLEAMADGIQSSLQQ